ncbi:hypothetical protein J28TS4_04860 [Paenibacillus lautus]|uniref:hypothetical protein n=1 Tax=Paenibacillus lautus TaxID=1401 RepID=UPI001B18D0F9|nr:hypothetical protein [Paenibacillus lautus]GIP02079.1 hypothetical protein J28TS4_04860 [Paenibacillus lautus]
MSEQNKIDEIKAVLAAATEIRTSPWNIGTPSPNGCINIGSRGVMVAQCLEPSPADLIAKAPEYITYLLQEIEREDEALKWYASHWNHEVQLEDAGLTSMQLDNGKRAREAL